MERGKRKEGKEGYITDDEGGPSGGVCAIPTSSCVSVSTGLGGDTTSAAALRLPLLPEALRTDTQRWGEEKRIRV